MRNSYNRKWLYGILGLTMGFSVSCDNKPKKSLGASVQPSTKVYKTTDFPNTLDLHGKPKNQKDYDVFMFSDQGAWHGFSLPDVEENIAGFSGPFLMTDKNGFWLSKQFTKLELSEPDGTLIKLKTQKSDYLPGKLVQVLANENLELTLELIFTGKRTNLVKAQIKNITNNNLTIKARLTGDIFEKGAKLKQESNGVSVAFENSSNYDLILPYAEVTVNGNAYVANLKKELVIEQESTIAILWQEAATFNKEERAEAIALTKEVDENVEQYIKNNTSRWSTYINKALSENNPFAKDPNYNPIAVKAVNTLLNNWRTAAGELKHEGLFPSYNYVWFHGFWAWDSWKHSVALAKIAPTLAQNQIRAMMDYQDDKGMVIDCIFRDTEIEDHNRRDTKPPLTSWAVWKVFKQSGDIDFLKELYPKLEKYHNWWYEYRDHDKNGLCEYGSTDGTVTAARWESGMDNAIRFDHYVQDETYKMLKNKGNGWSLSQESVDLNSYLYDEKLHLAKIATAIGKETEAAFLLNEADALKSSIQTMMFDEKTGFFYDIDIDTKKPIIVQGPEGWIPLWAGVATQEQADAVKNVILDTERFNTKFPFPTIAANHERFDLRGYWRGPVWLDQAYFGIEGLERYGFHEEANMLIKKIFDNAEGLKGNGPIRENYNPNTGEGLKANHFSWSAGHILMMFQERPYKASIN